ncbi:hypothetical protein [Spartinivicinus ruber]|uniref:hypothetical protein n=1 Tax=Spartinivicinus ruber TaxID=2683272 RepID=UPI0013D7316D|nr:hypothetical protein [Spartinivicinus ruber]
MKKSLLIVSCTLGLSITQPSYSLEDLACPIQMHQSYQLRADIARSAADKDCGAFNKNIVSLQDHLKTMLTSNVCSEKEKKKLVNSVKKSMITFEKLATNMSCDLVI